MGGVRGTHKPLWPVVFVLAAGAVGVLYLTFATTPLDLAVYRLGGSSVLHDAAHLYTFTVGDYPFTYPPLAAILFTPLAVIPERAATFLVTALSMAALARSMLLVARLAPWSLWRTAWGLPLAIVASGALEPIYETLHFGQVNLLIMWAVLEDLLAPPTRRWRGVLIGVAAGVKLTPLAFLLIPLLQRQWRTLLIALGTFVAGIALGFTVVPSAAYEFWTRAMLDPNRTGDVGFAGNQSINGLVARATQPGGDLLWWIVAATVVLAGTVLASYLLLRRDAVLEAVLATAMGGLLFSPVSWVHHFVWEVPVLMVLGATLGGHALASRARVFTWVLTVAWLVASLTRTPYWFPYGDGREYLQPWPEQLVTDSFTLIAVATLVWLAVVAGRQEPADENLSDTRARERT